MMCVLLTTEGGKRHSSNSSVFRQTLGLSESASKKKKEAEREPPEERQTINVKAGRDARGGKDHSLGKGKNRCVCAGDGGFLGGPRTSKARGEGTLIRDTKWKKIMF